MWYCIFMDTFYSNSMYPYVIISQRANSTTTLTASALHIPDDLTSYFRVIHTSMGKLKTPVYRNSRDNLQVVHAVYVLRKLRASRMFIGVLIFFSSSQLHGRQQQWATVWQITSSTPLEEMIYRRSVLNRISRKVRWFIFFIFIHMIYYGIEIFYYQILKCHLCFYWKNMDHENKNSVI